MSVGRTLRTSLLGKVCTVALMALAGMSCSEDSAQPEAQVESSPSSPGQSSPGDPSRPNILFVVLDDVGLDMTTGIVPGETERLLQQYGPEGLGHGDYERIDGGPASMPVLDALAREGLVFANAWAEPFCSPTRAALLTGLYPQRTGVLDYTGWLSQNHLSLATQLKAQGYSTALFGKWHLSGLHDIRPEAPPHEGPLFPGMKPKEAGFDLFLGDMNGALPDYWDYDIVVQDDETPADEWRTVPVEKRSLPGITATTFAPVVKVADTIDWIRAQEAANPDKPWFSWLAFNLPHIQPKQPPVVVPDRDTLDDISLAEMEACGGEFGSQNLGNCSPAALNRAMSTATDTVLGHLFDAVAELDPNTYIIVIGDNGTGQYGRPAANFLDNMYITYEGRGKGTGYESGVRVPLIVHGPGISARRSNAIVHAVDMFSTILDLADAEVPSTVPNSTGDTMIPVDSVSLHPILLGSEDSVRDSNNDYITAETRNLLAGGLLQASARNGTYKVMCTRIGENSSESCEFYNLVEDPLEEYPLATPQSCESSATPADAAWHYCHLKDAIATQTIVTSNRL